MHFSKVEIIVGVIVECILVALLIWICEKPTTSHHDRTINHATNIASTSANVATMIIRMGARR